MNRIFEVVLVHPETGFTPVTPARFSRRSFAELAIELENLDVCFRSITDVTNKFPVGYSPNDFVPAQFLNQPSAIEEEPHFESFRAQRNSQDVSDEVRRQLRIK